MVHRWEQFYQAKGECLWHFNCHSSQVTWLLEVRDAAHHPKRYRTPAPPPTPARNYLAQKAVVLSSRNTTLMDCFDICCFENNDFHSEKQLKICNNTNSDKILQRFSRVYSFCSWTSEPNERIWYPTDSPRVIIFSSIFAFGLSLFNLSVYIAYEKKPIYCSLMKLE
jgi:hypothetical protein